MFPIVMIEKRIQVLKHVSFFRQHFANIEAIEASAEIWYQTGSKFRVSIREMKSDAHRQPAGG